MSDIFEWSEEILFTFQSYTKKKTYFALVAKNSIEVCIEPKSALFYALKCTHKRIWEKKKKRKKLIISSKHFDNLNIFLQLFILFDIDYLSTSDSVTSILQERTAYYPNFSTFNFSFERLNLLLLTDYLTDIPESSCLIKEVTIGSWKKIFFLPVHPHAFRILPRT